jgi:uncharacterized protein YbjT (DUF2867 family)
VGGVCDGVDGVVSALGASVAPSSPERRSYFEVDRAANLNLVSSAVSGGVRRFVYVAVHVTPGYDHVAYVRAHEEVVETLRHAGIPHSVVRPTGVFTAFDDVLHMARRGIGLVLGAGTAHTNPIHPDDVARVVLDHAVGNNTGSQSVGGPEVFTRREIAELAARAWDRTPRVWSLPPRATRLLGRVVSRRSDRLGELFQFAAAVAVTDCVAPAVGTRRLADYFAERVAELRR